MVSEQPREMGGEERYCRVPPSPEDERGCFCVRFREARAPNHGGIDDTDSVWLAFGLFPYDPLALRLRIVYARQALHQALKHHERRAVDPTTVTTNNNTADGVASPVTDGVPSHCMPAQETVPSHPFLVYSNATRQQACCCPRRQPSSSSERNA